MRKGKWPMGRGWHRRGRVLVRVSTVNVLPMLWDRVHRTYARKLSQLMATVMLVMSITSTTGSQSRPLSPAWSGSVGDDSEAAVSNHDPYQDSRGQRRR